MRPDNRRALARLAAFGVLSALLGVGLLVAPHSAHRLHHDLNGLGPRGPLLVIGLSAALTCAFVPGPVLAGGSGRAPRAEENPSPANAGQNRDGTL